MSYEAFRDERDNEKGVRCSVSEEKKTVKRKVIWELKTASDDISPGSSYWALLDMDPQIAGYMLAEPEAEAVVYDVIKKTTLRPTGKGSETEESYFKRVLQQIAEDPMAHFQRGVLTRTDAELDEYRSDMVGIAAGIVRARKHGMFPRHVGKNTCRAYFSDCDYLPVCRGVDTIDSEHYTTRPPSDKGLPVLSHSAADCWRLCPRKYQYAYELRRRKVGEPSQALSFGKAMHTAVQAFHNPKAGFGNDGLERALYRVEKMPPGHDRAHAKALVHGYAEVYKDDAMKLTDIERWFTMPLTSPDGRTSDNFQLGGSIDAVGEMP